MKIRFIFSLIICAFISAVSCQSKNKAAAPTSKEEISIPDGSSTGDIVIGEINEDLPPVEEVIEEAIKQTMPQNVKDEIVTKSNTSKSQPTSTKEVVETIKKTTTESVTKPKVTKPETNVPSSKPNNTTTNNVITKATDPIIKNDKVKEVIDEKVKETATTKPEKPIKVDVPVGYPNHKLFDNFLKNYVSNSGNVNYAGIKKNEASLDAYLTTLENTKFNTTWSREDKLAFWINAYNAYTIKLILNNYPVAKITDLHAGKPWDHKWIKLTGKTLSLNNIENDIIRPEFKEPRIHFAVNCAAKSCPPLLNAAYTAGNLESKLDSQTKKFVNNSEFNTLGKSEITISKIFEWYGSDFGDVASYIARYADTVVKPTAKVKFNEYDWNLNRK